MKLLACALTLMLSLNALADDAIKAVIVSGGCCHDYKNQKSIIEKGLSERGTFTFAHIGEDPAAVKKALSVKGWADNYDVVIYNFCDAGETDANYIQSVVDVHKVQGKAAIMVHCAMHSYHWKVPPSRQDYASKEWTKLIGVGSPGHGPKDPIEVKTTDEGKKHPILTGIPETWKTPQGELYATPFVHDSATVLANGTNKKGTQAVIWVNTYGKAKIFGTTLGHHNETMNDKNWQDMFARGVLWSVDKLK